MPRDSRSSLAGLVVLDLTRLLPGPFKTQILVELGACVIKIEEPATGDYARTMWGAFEPVRGKSSRVRKAHRSRASIG